jgi:hypothetical protein
MNTHLLRNSFFLMRKIRISLFLLLFSFTTFFSLNVWGQNAIIGSGFTSGWGGACNSSSGFEYFSTSAGTSYISTQNASGTGNQYFRLGIDWSGTVAQNTITVGSDVAVTPNTEYTLNNTCTTSGAMYINVGSTSDNYIFKTKDAGTNPSRQMIVFCVQGAVQTISSVSRNYTTVLTGLSPTITANLSGSLATGQKVYLRYTTNSFSTSTIVEMTGSGTTYTASIPTQAASANVSYYVFTSGTATPSHANADWYTINLNNNAGSNYSYTVSSGGNQYRSLTSGNWNSTSTWQVGNGTEWGTASSTPTSSDGIITILNGHTVTVNSSITIDQTTIDAGGKVILATSGAITVANGADANDFTINGIYERQAFATTMTPTGTVYFGSGSTYIHNVNGGTIPTITWHSNSTLQIDQSVSDNEFTETFGNVTINGSSSFSMYNGGSVNTMNIAGNLTFNSSGTVYIAGPACNATQTLNVTGNYSQTGAGTFICRKYSSTLTFNVSGNFSQSAGIFTLGAPSGTFNYNGTITVTGDMTISGGQFNIHKNNGSSNAISNTVNVNGNFSMSSGGLLFSDETGGSISANSVFALLNVTGNFTHTGGTISETATDADVVTKITLNGTTGTQTLESTGQTGTIDFNVAASGAQCVIAATKTFTLSSASKMTVGAGTSNPDLLINGTFLTLSTAGSWMTASGNIHNYGSIIFQSTGATSAFLGALTNQTNSNFTFKGTGSFVPSLNGRNFYNLLIESTSGAYSVSGSGSSALSINGDLTIGANCTFGPNVTGTPGHSVKGNITIGSGGTLNYNPASAGTINLNGSGTQTISGAGTFITGANATLLVAATSTIDFGATNAIAGSGTFTTLSGSTLITANTSGINGSLTLTNKTLNAGTNYSFNGSSAQETGAALSAANNITLNNSNGLTLSANTSITGTLTLTSGKLTTNGFTLALSNAVSGSSSSNYIVADATGTATFNGVTTARVFPLGTTSAYAPMTVTAGSSTNYTAYVTGTSTWPGSCTPTTTSQMVNLAWGLSGSNIPSQVVFQWPAGSQAGSFAPATSCDLGRYNTSCPYNVANISAASGSGPYTLTCTTGLGSTSNIYVIGNQHAVYIAAPTVTTTVAASSITNTTASSGGQTLSGTNITSKGVVWNTATAPTTSNSSTNDGTGTSNYSSSLSSLSPQTLYYIRAYATNAAGTGYGDEKTFRTLSNPATVQASGFSATATSASNIDLSWTGATFPSSGATAKGYVLLRATSPNTPSLGNSNGVAPSAGTNTTIVSSVLAENATSISNTGLASSTQYNYLLIPYTWDGTNASTYNYLTSSAPTANATTSSGSTPPVLTTNASTSISNNAATFNGDVTSDGGSTVTERGFVYSTSDATPTIGEGGVTQQTVSGTTGAFSYNASSLSANSTYYVQAYATNTSGTTYGGVDQFTTLKNEPTAQATSLVFSSITTSSFNVAFTAATGSPDGYVVVRSTSATLSSNPVDGTTYTAGNSLGGGTVVSVGSTISGIANSSLSAGTTYYMYVFSYNNSGSNINYLTTSPLSNSTITITGVPATPTFSSINTTSFTVDWTATTGASSYRLDVSTASDFSSYVSGYQDLTVNGTSQAVTGLTANTLYYVRIRAVNASGTSANSTSGNSATLSNAPAVSTASSITTSGLTANWTAPSSQGAVTITYTIELSTSSSDFSSPVSTVSSIASGTTSNAFTSLSEGTTYYYRIKAVNSAGSSAWSSVSAGATTLTSSISLTALGTSSTQDFNTLATSGTSSTLPSGWYLSESGLSANSTLSANDGSASSGETYSYGTSTNSDRAFGGLRSGSVIPTIGAKFQNSTGSVINNLSISYIGEQWRLGSTGRNDRLDFQYSLDATSISSAGTWTDVNSLDFSGPISSGTTGALSGNSSSNRTEITHTITGLTIADGAIFYIRWSDVDATGADDGLAVDDFSIKPCGTVSAPTASDQAFCSAVSPTVASLTVTGTAPKWYSASTGGTALSTSMALTNSTTYYATQTIDGCESVSRTPVVVTINTNPSAPTGSATQTLCSGATVNDLTATGTSLQWYAASSGGTALATNTALINNTHYYASQTTNSCESATRLDVTAAIVSSGSWIGGTSTDWSNAANWCGGVPTSSTNVTIPSGTANSVVISSSVSVNSLTINSGATLSTSGTPTITIANNGSLTNNGTFTAGTSKVSFAGNGTVSGTVAFNDVDIAGGVNFGTASTVNGTLSMNANSFINTNAPTYGINSTLKYNTGGDYGRSTEWSTTSGAGAPYSVQLSNNTTLNYPNSANGGANAFSTNLSLAGNLTVDNGSALYMDYGGNANKSGRLDISGNVLLNGNLSLGNASGGDIKVGGNWTRNSGSTFNANGRAVFINGTGTSIITGNGGETFPYLVNDKTSGTIQLGSNVTLTSPSGGNALTHKSTASLDLNGFDLTFSGPASTTILANGACNVTGTGNIFITNNSKTLTQSSGTWTFGSNVVLRLQSGLNFGNNISTVNGTLEINSGGYVTSYGPNYGSGSLLKYNTGNAYGRNVEWYSDNSSGVGIPYNVLISSNTTLDIGANNNSSFESWISNDLTLDGTLSLAETDQLAPLNVSRNVIFNNGTLILSTTAGGDIKVGGNWSGTGTFTPNSRAVFFNGTGNQTISRNENFPYLFVNKSSGTLTFAGAITLNNKLTYSNGTIALGVGGSIDASGASAEVEFANSSVYTLPTGMFTGNVNKLTLNGNGGVNLSENLTVTGNLTLTNGDLNIGANTLTLGSSSSVTSGSSSSHVNATSTGEIRKIYSSNASFIFPVGDGTNYTPATLNFTAGSSLTGASDDFVGVRLKTSKVTDMNSANTTFLNRSWFIEPGAGLSGYTYTVNLKYADADVNGTESNIKPVKKSSGVWHYPGDASFEYGTQLTGTSTSGTDYNTNILVWSGLTSFSEFGGGGQGGPLPVELVSFNAICEEDVVKLNWSTASEKNSSHFDIEKSQDGIDWILIGSVPAAGNSNEEITYSFQDNTKSYQEYYRLNQFDFDGKNKIYGPISADCKNENSEFMTFPNPSEKNGFSVVLNSSELSGLGSILMTDSKGNLVYQKQVEIQKGISLWQINEADLAPGIYFIKITNGSNSTKVLKHTLN